MEGHAKGVLTDLADTCSEGALIFRETDKDNAYCSLILIDTGAHSICQHADDATIVVEENGQQVIRHRCFANSPSLEIAPAEQSQAS